MDEPILDPNVGYSEDPAAAFNATALMPDSSPEALIAAGYHRGVYRQDEMPPPGPSVDDMVAKWGGYGGDKGYQPGDLTQPNQQKLDEIHNDFSRFLTPDALSASPDLPHPEQPQVRDPSTGEFPRKFNGDESIKAYRRKVQAAYEKAMYAAGGRAEDVRVWAQAFGDKAEAAARQYSIMAMAKNSPNMSKPMQALTGGLENVPFAGRGYKAGLEFWSGRAQGRISQGQGDLGDYRLLADDMSRQSVEAQRGLLTKVLRGTASMGTGLMEMGAFGPASPTGGTLETLGTAARYTGATLPFNVVAGLANDKPLSEIGKQEAGEALTNILYSLTGGKAPAGLLAKAGDAVAGVMKMLATQEVSQDAQYSLKLSEHAGAVAKLMAAKTPEERERALHEFVEEGGPLAIMELIMKGVHSRTGVADIDPSKVRSPQELANAFVAKTAYDEAGRRDSQAKPPSAIPEPTVKPAAPASPNDYIQTDKGWFSRREAEAQGLLPKAGGAEPAATPSTAQPPPPEPRKPLADFSDDDVRGLAKQFGLDARGSRETLLKRLNDMDKGRTVASLESLSAPPAKVAEAQGPPTIAQEPRAEEPAQAPAQAPERRQDVERRRAVAEMSPEEMRKELLTNPVTGLPNRRAFDEAGPAKAVGMSDADGLKALNDKFGYEAGDTMLRAKAEALKEAGLDAYHEKGDEFLYRGGSKEELGQKLERARSILRDKIIHTEKAGDFKGADFSYGHGADRAEAETGLKAHKAQREAAGERARGELRGITQVGAGPSGQDLGRAAPGDHGEAPAPRAAVGKHPLEPHVRNALTRDEVGTSKEIWQDVNQQRQKKGLAKAPFAQVREALDRMKGRGDIIEHPGAEGDDPIHTLTGQEGEATPEAVEKAKRDLKESINADIANRQRNGGEPASVRRALNGDLQKATPLARSAIAREEAAAGQGARAAGVPEVPHSAGASAERAESATGRGGPASSDVVAEAKRIRANDREDVADHNAIMRAVWARLKPFGVEARDYKKNFEDASKVPELDKAADYWAQARPDKFVRPGEEPSDILHDMLRKGMRKPMSNQESLEKAEDYLRSQANLEEHANAQQEGRLAGYSAEAVRQHVARIEAEVRAEAEAEERAEKEREHEQAETAAERAAIEQPAASGEPAGREPWDLIAGESGAVNLKALAKFFGFKEDEPTGIANAMAAKERQKARLPPVQQPSPVGHSYPELRDQVLQIARTDPTRIDRLVEELQKKSRPVTDLEDALLLHRQNDIRNQYGDSLHKLIQAQAGGDAADLQGATATERDVRERLRDITDVTKQVGTESARGLAARKMMVNQDFSLANMLMQSEAAKGRPLTAEEKADLVRQQHNIADTEGKRVAAESALAQEGGGAKSPLFPEMQKAQVAAEEAKDAWRRGVQADRDANRPLGQRMEDFLTKLRRAMVISSPTTMAKIIAASAERIAISPMEEAVGAVLAKLPGISKIAAMAPREGRGLNFDAEKRAFTGAFTDGMKDAWSTVKSGHSELDTLYGDTSHPRSWLDLVGELHGAGKAPAVRAEYTRSFLKRIDAEAAQGKDVTSPAALTRLGLEAYKDSQAAKFQQQNWLADGIKRFLRPAPNASAGERAAKFAGRMVLPVVTVPTNLVFEASRYAFGTATGSAQAGLALARGVENLKPAEADNIMQQLKKGSLGLAALALGYYAPKAIGGFYSGKRKPDDVEAGAIGSVPSYVLHNPLLEILQMGSTVRRVSDKQGWGEGVAKSVLGLGEQIPLVREATDVGGKGLSLNPKVRGQYFGDLAKSLAVPQLVQWLAGRLDTKETATSYANPLTGEVQKRRPVGVLQHVQEGVPGLRNLLPKR